MGNKPKKPCSHPRCPALTLDRYCDRHKDQLVEDKAEVNAHYDRFVRDKNSTAFYKSKVWRETRAHVLRRDNHLCQHCYQDKRIRAADMVHHIEELKDAWDKRLLISNLISLCNSCHNRAHGNSPRPFIS
jgi:5-methylcytosine-specific restriction enzyme A